MSSDGYDMLNATIRDAHPQGDALVDAGNEIVVVKVRTLAALVSLAKMLLKRNVLDSRIETVVRAAIDEAQQAQRVPRA